MNLDRVGNPVRMLLIGVLWRVCGDVADLAFGEGMRRGWQLGRNTPRPILISSQPAPITPGHIAKHAADAS